MTARDQRCSNVRKFLPRRRRLHMTRVVERAGIEATLGFKVTQLDRLKLTSVDLDGYSVKLPYCGTDAATMARWM